MMQNPSSSNPVRPARRRRAVWISVIILGIVLMGALFARREMGAILARKLEERLSAQGIHLTWQSADWLPGPGIRVNGLSLYQDESKETRLAYVGHVIVMKGEPEWNRWDTMDASVTDTTLILGSGDGETSLEHLQLRLRIEPGRVELKKCSALLQGLKIVATGMHTFASPAGPAAGEGNAQPARARTGRFDAVDLGWLKSVKQWTDVVPKNEPPLLKVEFTSAPGDGGLELNAELSGREFQWLGQTWDMIDAAAAGRFGSEKSAFEIGHAKMGFAGGVADFEGGFDPSSNVLRIDECQSTINVLALTKAFVPGAAQELGPLSSAGSWNVQGKGEIPLGKPDGSRWSGRVALDGDLVYQTGEARVALKKPSCTVRLEGGELSLTALKAGLWDGRLSASRAKVRLPTAKAGPRFEARLALEDARLESVMSSFGPAEKQPGTVQCNWSGAGAFDLASFTSTGTLGIHGAEFFRVPLFGALARLLDKLSPGFGRDQTSKVEAAHRTSKGTLRLENLTLDNAQTHIEAEGTIDLRRRYADLTAKARMKGVLGFFATALAGGIDATGKGPVGDVKWER